MKNKNQLLSSFSYTQIAYLLLIVIFIAINCPHLIRHLTKIQRIKKVIPYQFDGFKFAGLENILKNEQYVGYFTDKDLKENAALKQFSQAQYVLAPIILDPDDLDHPFILIDCSSDEVAIQKIKELKLQPLKRNRFGIILARKL